MPTYKYKAIDKEGSKSSGLITAANVYDLEARIKSMNMYLISHKEVKKSTLSFFSKISLQEMIIFCVHMESLDRAGVPLLDAVTDLRDTAETPAMKNLMSDLYESLTGGEMLSQAMAKHPDVFDNMFVGLIKAGEKTGKISDVFKHLADHLKWVALIRAKIKKAIYYPIFLLLIIIGVITQMMVFVIPKLSDFLTNQGFALPWYTYALISTSHFFLNYWYIVFLTPVGIVFFIWAGSKLSYSFRFFMHKVYLHTPVFGNAINKIEMSRFCRFFAISYQSGIGVLECLDIAGNVIKNLVIKQAIIDAKARVIEGTPLSISLEKTKHFPSLVIRMFKVGEDSGALDSSLQNVNFFYDKEVEDAVNGLIGIIQPALTLILGMVVMWITIAVFGPLYASFSKIKF
jgi:type IV pilus assembly protein PilC